ncbi:hypothetical protein BCR44DRAFT_129329 [Catenaria anguillulae PL171]|uniref:Uncharacterized protein n=1 Tax=Catenaria anguillulae PL171 TaxID=765915 RepID=A0A1Y2HD08_9FUNG|nr:hypothetical protein BCR44DRAFT_129329 [Catenaria anguillulae PL171]
MPSLVQTQVHTRWLSTTRPRNDISSGQEQQQQPLPKLYPIPPSSQLVQVYEGPLARTVRLMKLFSISSLGATLAMAPLVFYIDVSDVISDSVKTLMMGTAIGFSAVSTSLIHWCLSSYITRIYALPVPASVLPPSTSPTETRDPAIDAADWTTASGDPRHPLAFESLTITGQRKLTIAPLDQVKPKHVIFGSWHAYQVVDARTGKVLSGKQKKMFVHADAARQGVLGEPARVIAEAVAENGAGH